MTSPLLNDLLRLAIQFASRSMEARRKTSLLSVAMIGIGCVMAIVAAGFFLAAVWIIAEQEWGHRLAPVAMGVLFSGLCAVTILVAVFAQKRFRKSQRLAAQREEMALQLALILKDHKGLVILSALAAGLFAGTSR